MKVDIDVVLKRVRNDIKTLNDERDRLASEIVNIDAEISALVGGGALRSKNGKRVSFKRYKNERTLLGTMHHVMQGKPYTLDAIVDLVLEAGYKSRGDRASLKNMIYQKLYTAGKRNDDGTYSLKRTKRSLAASGK